LLGQIYESDGRKDKALAVYRRALEVKDMPNEAKAHFASRIEMLSGS